jgi:hypothetical protein
MSNPKIPIGGIIARAFTIPAGRPEAQGTYGRNTTTLIAVCITAGDKHGITEPYLSRPGNGRAFKHKAAEIHAV